MLQNVWAAPIGVQFQGEAEIFNLSAKIREIGLQGGFAAGNDDAIQKSSPLIQKIINRCPAEMIGAVFRPPDQIRVMAVRTVEVATRAKDDGAYLARKIDQ